MDKGLFTLVRAILLILVFLLFTTPLLYSTSFIDAVFVPKIFWLFIIVGLLTMILFMRSSLGRSVVIVQLNQLDLWLLGYYLFCTISFISHGMVSQQAFAIQSALTASYIIFKVLFVQDKSLFVKSALLGLLFAAIGQLLIGLLQITGHLQYMSSGFIVSGTFGNPGPYAIFIAVISSFALPWAIWSRLSMVTTLVIVLCLLSAFVLPIAGSRTSWIAIFVSTVLLGIITNKRFMVFLADRVWKRVGILVTFFVLSIALVYYLIDYRRESAEGRVFIWSNTADIIGEYPLLGVGYGQFQSYYPDYQAAYFQTHTEDKANGYLAGDISHAFNEYLELATELGVVGLAVFSIFIFLLVYHGCRLSISEVKDPTLLGSLTCVITILVAAFFSYPFHSISIMICFYFAAALISSNLTNYYTIKIGHRPYILIAFGVLISISYGSYILWAQYNAEAKWSRAVHNVKSLKWKEAKELYKDIYPILDDNTAFLFNYGAELSAHGEFKESIKYLSEAEKNMKSTDIYTYLGNSYLGIGDFLKAEDSYLKASQIIPHKLFPKYQLVNLYLETGKTDKAASLANDILRTHAKVDSEIASHIKEEMKILIQNQLSK